MNEANSIDLLIEASWIIPVVPSAHVLKNSAVAVSDGKIVALGTAGEINSRYTVKHSIKLSGHALIPGLVNAHGHAAMTLMRGFADDRPLMDWLQNHIWPAEQKWVSDEFVADGTRLAIAEMLATGTTCFSDMYFFPEYAASAALESGIRAQLMFPVMDFPTAWGSGPEDYLRKGIALKDQYRSHNLISVGFGPHAPYTVSDEPLQRIATYAEEMQAPVQIHLHETAGEVTKAVEQTGMRPIERLHKLGFLSPLVQCVHMTQVDDVDIEVLRETGAHIVHCPESNLKLASGICPTERLRQNEINVCLGTDGAASNNNLDMFSEMRTAALVGKISAGDASAVSAVSALEMATINGAKALGLSEQIGSLEAGKYADIAAIDLRGLEHQPVYDVISHLVYSKVGHKVPHLWINGKALVRDYELQSLNVGAIRDCAFRWQKKLKGKRIR